MRNIFQKLVVVFLLINAMSLMALSQTRVRFAKGRSSATVTGFLGSEEKKSYVVGAIRGQKMTLTLRAFGGTVIVTDRQGNKVEMPEDKQTMGYIFSDSGDVTITVYKEGGGGTEYSLKIAIEAEPRGVANTETSGGSSADAEWNSFWTAFHAAAQKRDRRKLETLMSRQFIAGGGLFGSTSERISFLNGLSQSNWRKMDIALKQGATFSRDCDCRKTKTGARLEFRQENGKWLWAEAWFSGD